MKHKRLAKFLANALGFALLTVPATMAFAGCETTNTNSSPAAEKILDISLYEIADCRFYELKETEELVAEKSQQGKNNDEKSLDENTLNELLTLMDSLGDEYAQKMLLFNSIDENGENTNSFGEKFSMLDIYIAYVNSATMQIILNDRIISFGLYLSTYAEDEINEILKGEKNISDLDILNCYVAFFKGYLKNAPEYILSNYFRYEDLTDEQINQILNIFEENMSTTAEICLVNRKKKFAKFKNAVSFDEANIKPVPEVLFVSSDDGYSISTIVDNIIDNFYPADLMYFEQPFVDYYQSCIDPLFQENFGYTWSDCVKLTEDPDLHSIDWDNGGYYKYFSLLGMTLDDIPMPTLSDNTITQDDTLTK